jgi:drug/metabolite transporter (DMT)-like permease
VDWIVFTAVLAGAAMHAGWNALVKIGLDRFLSMTLVAGGAGLVSAAALPFVGLPKAEAWPFIVASVLFHIGYKGFLVLAYRTGDMAQVYPIARGTPPLAVALISLGFLYEPLSARGLLGIVLLAGGVILMSFRGGRQQAVQVHSTGVAYALLTAACTTAYTIVDGLGSRAAGSPHAYALWFFALDGLLGLVIALGLRGGQALAGMTAYWRQGLGGGVLMLGSYWIALWAMSKAPIAIVAALRETSVLFGAMIATFWLKEPMTHWRAIAALIIVAGIVLTRLN